MQYLAQLWGYRVKLVEQDVEGSRVLKEHEALPTPRGFSTAPTASPRLCYGVDISFAMLFMLLRGPHFTCRSTSGETARSNSIGAAVSPMMIGLFG